MKNPVGRPRKAVIDELGSAPPADAGDEMLQRIADAFDQSGGARIVARVFQKDEKGISSAIFDIDPSSVLDAFEKVRREYGSGSYEVIVYREGKFAQRHPFYVKVPASWKPPAIEETKVGMDPGFAAILQRMDERAERSERMTMALLERIANPAQGAQQVPSSPFDLADKMMSTMKTMMETMGGAKSEGMFDAVMKGVELRDKLAGSGEGSNFYDIIREGMGALPAIAEIVKNIPRGESAAPVAPPPRPQLGRPVPQPDPFVGQVAFLVERAKAESDPEVYAAMMHDVLPDEMLKALLAQADPAAVFASLHPEAGAYRPWFSQMVDFLRDLMQDDDGLPAEEGVTLAAGDRIATPAADIAGPPGRRTRGPGNHEGDARRRS